MVDRQFVRLFIIDDLGLLLFFGTFCLFFLFLTEIVFAMNRGLSLDSELVGLLGLFLFSLLFLGLLFHALGEVGVDHLTLVLGGDLSRSLAYHHIGIISSA